jgi:hypothetical protein
MSTNNNRLDYTQKYRIRSARVNYAHYLENRKILENNETVNSIIYPPDNDASIVTLLKEGIVATTIEEYNRYLNIKETIIEPSNNQPINPCIESTPYITPYITAISRNAEAFLFFPRISSVSNYEYSLDGGTTFLALSPAQTISPIRITGLVNLTKYTILLRPIIGGVPGEILPPAIVTPGVPNPPINLLVTPGDGQVNISFTIIGNGGSNITNYEYSINNGPFQPFSPAQIAIPITITGLTNGTSYSIQLKAVNIRGASEASDTVTGIPTTQICPTTFSNYSVGTFFAGASANPENARVRFFNPGGSSASQLKYSFDATNKSIYLLKQDYNGVAQWAALIDGSTGVSGPNSRKMTKDKDGNIYVYGNFISFAKIYNSGPGDSIFKTLPTYAGNNDLLIVKYNSSGMVLWVVRIIGIFDEANLSGITTDNNNNSYIFAFTNSQQITIFYSDDSTEIVNTGFTNQVLIKLNSLGVGEAIARTTNIRTNDLICDSEGNIYACGFIQLSPATIISKDGTVRTLTGSNRGCFFKINNSGILQWALTLNSTSSQILNVAFNKITGSLFITGIYRGVLTINNAQGGTLPYTLPYSGNPSFSNYSFIIKYDTNGLPIWAARIATSGTTSSVNIKNCVLDKEDNCYLSGTYGFTGLNIFNAGNSSSMLPYTLPESNGNNTCLIKYDTNGTAMWACHSSLNTFGSIIVWNLEIDDYNNLYFEVMFDSGNITFYYPRNIGSFWYTINNGASSCIVKYDKNGVILFASKISAFINQ